jgi:hypothetical protein
MLYVGVYTVKDTSNFFQVKIMAIVIQVYGRQCFKWWKNVDYIFFSFAPLFWSFIRLWLWISWNQPPSNSF